MMGNQTEASSSKASGATTVSFRSRLRRPNSIDTVTAEAEHEARSMGKKPNNTSKGVDTPNSEHRIPLATAGNTVMNGNKTPSGLRGKADLRSPGVKKTPKAAAQDPDGAKPPPPDFITQTDKYGNASTPRSADAIAAARASHPSGPKPKFGTKKNATAREGSSQTVVTKKTDDTEANDEENKDGEAMQVDACETLLESLRMMCCCLMPEDSVASSNNKVADASSAASATTVISAQKGGRQHEHSQYSPRGPNAPMLLPEDSMVGIPLEEAAEDENRIRLLGKHHTDDEGKKCLVLDLDETLVHSSFRAVPGADFVIPVQIEDVVHFVYVAKRPGVDEFLIEMAKHYEIVVYTASLNKYADPLLDLLDPHRTIRTRLFRESCVYYEGNYVKDLSLLDRDLSQAIIVDNSPSSYIFHPENAIDCTSFIDDPHDQELDQIGSFLMGIRNVKDVRDVCAMWKQWPDVPKVLEGMELPDKYDRLLR